MSGTEPPVPDLLAREVREAHYPHGEAQDGSGPQIALVNVKYSPNLGDGLLAECLERELSSALPGCVVHPIDLGGRDDFGGGHHRAAILSVFKSTPPIMRRAIVRAVVGRSLTRKHRPLWRRTLAEVDAVVVGGGNLFSDSDLNFPLKIAAALEEAARFDLPIAVFGVGVSDNWSREGEALFRGALSRVKLVHAMVRDRRSAEIWNRHLGSANICDAVIGQDPGLLVADLYPRAAARAKGGPPLVGIGITNPLLLDYHADKRGPRRVDLSAWLAELVRRCLAQGWNVVLFTNGSPEDVSYLDALEARLVALGPGGRVLRAPNAARPADLARFVAELDLVLAHRLHANIAAFSYGVPHIGFAWDAKMNSFFARMEMADRLCTPVVDSPEQVADLAAVCLASGIDPIRRGRAVAEAREDVLRLAAALRDGLAVGPSRVRGPAQWT